jgi:Tol biopolymer transport system component
MRKIVRILALGIVLLLTVGLKGWAQQSREVFGKNRIQYRQFDWQYLSGENFDVYFYDARKTVAREALDYLENEFDRITDLIGYPPYFKTKVFIYNSLSDLRQSNVGLNHNIYYVGGETEFIQPYIEVAHLGTAQEFKEELLYKVTDLMINEMMYGGNLKDVFQNALLLNLPDWFVRGASLYVAKGWTAEMDDYIRQLIKTKRAKKLSKFAGDEAGFIGQSIWNYIAERYGKSSVSNILNYTRVTRNEEKSVIITLGVNFNQMLTDWQKYYGQMADQADGSYVNPHDSLRRSPNHNATTAYTTVKLSPDGRFLAYAANDRGRYIVKVMSLNSGRETTILTHGSKAISQRIDYRLPILSWSDANTLGVIATRNGEYTFWLYDLSTKTKLPRELDRFSNVRSINFSSNGRLAVLSADFEGQNDLFLISTRRDRVRRLTNDIYDDLDPSFIPGSNRIVFSSNRVTDSLNVGETSSFASLTNNYNLFVYDLDTTNRVLKRVTNTLSKDYAPIALSNNIFYYLSDQRGIVNLFKYDLNTGIYSQISNYKSSIKEYDLNTETKTLAMVMSHRLKDDIFVDRDFNTNRQVFTPATRRKELQQARIVRARRTQDTEVENKNMSIKDLINARLKEAQAKDTVSSDTIPKASIDTVQQRDSVLVADTINVNKPKPERVVNTDNYTFEDEAVRETQPSESFLTRYMKAREKSRVTGPFPYETKFSANNLITSPVIDPLRGFGILIETQMNDMLENYRFFGGIMTTLDLHNGDVYAEFQYLPLPLDFSARFDRKSVRWEPYVDGQIYQYSLNKFELGAALPLSDRARITVKPFMAVARSTNLGSSSFNAAPPSEIPFNNYYAGVKSELVYDNSITTGLNIIEGTRGKITYTNYRGLNNTENSFGQIAADIRHYQKLYREIVFAVRGFGGSFFGRSPKQYLLGGMDNWILNRTEFGGTSGTGEENPLGFDNGNQDILFTEYATSLRGFNYSTLFGNNVLLLNAELRIPLVRALTNAPITSNFFRNLQFIGFYDIGTSWSGRPPFRDGAASSVDRINNKPFLIDIKKFINPWLYSYGVGMRTVVLGYYMKVDVAWPVENYEVQKPRWFVTLGFDF